MRKASYFLLFSIILASFSCGKINNSSSLDRIDYSATRPPGSALFLSVNSMLSSKCSGCHPAWVSFSESDFISGGLIVPQSPATSKLYFRNQNATIGPGPRTMPNSGFPALTSDEIQTMTDWINSL